MNNELPTVEQVANMQPQDYLSKYNPKVLEVTKKFLAPDLEDEELVFFLMTAEALQLNPLIKQIYAMKFPQKTDENGNVKSKEKLILHIGIDGYRAIGHRQGTVIALKGPIHFDENGVGYENWIWSKAPVLSKYGIQRSGMIEPVWAQARYEVYAKTVWDKHQKGWVPMGNWKTMPDVMLGKCAEALAWRMAFPAAFAGTIASEEIDAVLNTELEKEKIQLSIAASEKKDTYLENMREKEKYANLLKDMQKAYGLFLLSCKKYKIDPELSWPEKHTELINCMNNKELEGGRLALEELNNLKAALLVAKSENLFEVTQ